MWACVLSSPSRGTWIEMDDGSVWVEPEPVVVPLTGDVD